MHHYLSLWLAKNDKRKLCDWLWLQKDTTNILLFGGEYYDGRADKMRVYNDLFLLNTAKCTWTKITSPQGCA